MDIRIELNDTEVRRGLQRLIAAGADLSPAMRVIATHLADRAEDAFEQETSPTGQPWPPLKPATVKERTRKGYTPIKRLQRTGTLVRSILADWDNRTAVAGTNLIYAAPHQFGSDKRNIPARPFLGISTHDERVIQDIIARFIAERWRWRASHNVPLHPAISRNPYPKSRVDTVQRSLGFFSADSKMRSHLSHSSTHKKNGPQRRPAG